jgi:hypothetical protein
MFGATFGSVLKTDPQTRFAAKIRTRYATTLEAYLPNILLCI